MSHVLIVVSDPQEGEAIADFLVTALDVAVVLTGEQAMDHFIQSPAEVVLLEQELPGRNGITTAQALRSMPGGADTQVILTAHDEPVPGRLAEKARPVRPFQVRVGAFNAQALARLIEQAAVGPAATRVANREHVTKEIAEPWEDKTAPEPGPSHAATTLSAGAGPSFAWHDPDGRREADLVHALLARGGVQQGAEPRGSFEQQPFAEVLGALICARATGALLCQRDADLLDTNTIVYLRDGAPITVQSNLGRESFEKVLERRALASAETSSVVALGRSHPVELARAACEQLREKLLDLFSWTRGTHRFVTNEAPPLEHAPVGIGPAEILILGLARSLTGAAALAQLEPVLTLGAFAQPAALMRFVDSISEAALGDGWSALDGSQTVASILAEAPDRADTARILLALKALGAVVFREVVVEGTSSAKEITSSAPPHELSGRIELAREYSAQITLDSSEDDADDADSFEDRSAPVFTAGDSSAVHEKAAPEQSAVHRSSPASAEEPSQLDERVNKLLTAERHFRRGHRALAKDRAAESVEAFERAVSLCPEEGLFVAHLAWAKHAVDPGDAFALSEALSMAQRACQLAPGVAVVHLLQGRLLRSAQRPEESARAYSRALRLSPDNDEAIEGARRDPG